MSRNTRVFPAAPAIAATVVESNWGWLALASRPTGLLFASYPQEEPHHAWEQLVARFGSDLAGPEGAPELLAHATAHFQACFRGEAVAVHELPVLLDGTPFEIKVWEATRAIPWGRTLTYGDVAWEIERPLSARGVGRAMSRNRAGLLVPCHRVIAAGGRLGGYGGQEDRKERLLALEGHKISMTDTIRTRRK